MEESSLSKAIETIDTGQNFNLQEWQKLLEMLPTSSVDPSEILKVLHLAIKATQLSDNENSEKSNNIAVLSATVGNTQFISLLQITVISLGKEPDKIKLLKNILENVQLFCEEVLHQLPTQGKDRLLNLICVCIGVIASSSDKKPDLLDRFTGLQNRITEIETTLASAQKAKPQQDISDDLEYTIDSLQPPEDIFRIPIIPTLDELITEKNPFLRPNKVVGAYKNLEHYLDVQFRLLREDFVRPLRLAVQKYAKNRDEFIDQMTKRKTNREQDISVRFYTDLKFRGTERQREATQDYLFNLPDQVANKINWDKSKRLLPGCLVMLTGDHCKTAIFAVTLAPPFDHKKTGSGAGVEYTRRELAKGILRVSIADGIENIQEAQTYEMLECEAFFEAYRYNLGILQNIRPSIFATAPNADLISKFIVNVSTQIKPPGYLCISANHDDESERKKRLLQNSLSLDANQFQAYYSALNSELAVIQGPPGTGKTYVGLQIVKSILNRIGYRYNKSPILILCYTNHALDQFLELIIQEMPDLTMVRVGGQSKSEILKEHTLAVHRSRVKSQLSRQIRKEREKAKRKGPYYKFSYEDSSSDSEDYEEYFSEFVVYQKSREAAAYRKVIQWTSKLEEINTEVEELTNPSGLINFEKLKAYDGMKAIMPLKVLQVFSNADWLQLPDVVRADFDVDLLVSRWFVVNRNVTGSQKTHRTAIMTKVRTTKIESEEYDMQELLEHRLVSEANENYFQKADYRSKNIEKNLYIPDYSVGHCRDMKVRCMGNINRNFGTKSNLSDKQYREMLDFIENNKRNRIKFENHEALFSTIFGLKKEGRLNLPSMENVFYRNGINERYVSENVKVKYPIRIMWGIYFKLVEIALNQSKECRVKITSYFEAAEAVYLRQKARLDGHILRETNIIGMTTTGAAKMHELLEIAKPKIVIVEEAAEILEAHIVTSLTKDCQQLILIGDHQQLRPSTSVYELETKYKLNVSLFERLIKNKVPFHTLKTQHRMRSEISDLIIGPIYKELYNHKKVLKYPHVKGVKSSLYFINHSELEKKDEDLSSRSNKHEAEFLVALCKYLLNQGYQHEQITILATYTGQMFLLKKILPDFCKGVRITTVDNFQGEENDIILLSLVRSNKENNVGFLKIDNRICVALSRARHGLYVIGNIDGMVKVSHTWGEIRKKLDKGGNIGETLELVCVQHGNLAKVKTGKDFGSLVNGGCGAICGTILKCKHNCPLICHGEDQFHEKYQCKENCLKTCENNHPCLDKCSVECPPCEILVTKKLPCSHEAKVPCCKDTSSVYCKVKVLKTLDCELEHEVEVDCSQDLDKVKCRIQVEKILPCGDVLLAECDSLVENLHCNIRENKELSCGHFMELTCSQGEDQSLCKTMVEKDLPCTHVATMKCGKDVESYKCKNKVEKPLACGHKQILNCYRSNNPDTCKEIIEIVFPVCLHKVKVPCHLKATTKCEAKCNQTLKCGHNCPLSCHQNDDPEHIKFKCKEKCQRSCKSGHQCKYSHDCVRKCFPCDKVVNISLPCGHEIDVECAKQAEDYNCNKKIRKSLPCGHEQLVLCHVEPEKHKCTFQIMKCQKVACPLDHQCLKEHACYEYCPPCTHLVDKTLSCNHTAKYPCNRNETDCKCKFLITKKLACEHEVEVECSVTPGECKATVPLTCSVCLKEVMN